MSGPTGFSSDGDSRYRAIERLKAEISERNTKKAIVPAVDARRLADLAAQSRYHQERLSLYRAKAYGSTPTSPRRLHDLERASQDADRRLREFRLRSELASDGQSNAT